MKKIIITVFNNITIIGEYDLERNIVTDCLEMRDVNNTQFELKPVLLPFSIINSVIIPGDQLSMFVEVHPLFFENLITEFNSTRAKREIAVKERIKVLNDDKLIPKNQSESIH